MIMTLKFAFVAGCLVLAGLTYFRCHCRRDWAWLVVGLGFTVGADYFLVLHNEHLAGVAVFCFVHVCYILRRIGDSVKKAVAAFAVVGVLVAVAFFNGSVIMLGAVYASLFVANIVINLKTRLPKLNWALTLAGLVLFALCDINVLLFNLPRYFDVAHGISNVVFPLIWVFYLPSQLLLAISALDFKRG